MLPHRRQFKRVIYNFLESASVRPTVPVGRPPTSEEDIQRVKDFFTRNPQAHVRQAAEELGVSFGQVWMIMRKKLEVEALQTASGPGSFSRKHGIKACCL